MALTVTARVHVWGIKESGQLGRHRECDIHRDRDKACAYRPTLIPGYENKTFIKAIYGPIHSLLLTTKGSVYAFGDNSFGQVGNGTDEPQFRPVQINSGIQFKDVINYFENDLSIDISTDDQFYD
jgi:alpha-tubulin suppressor-like RCC1 family protein